jgi:hypothetical protein
VCAAAGACAFPDVQCPSGIRYGAHAGGLSGDCVPEDATTGSVADTGMSSSTTISQDASTTTDTGDPTNASTAVVDSSGAATTTGPEPGSSSEATAEDSTTGPSSDPDLLVWLRFDASSDSGFANHGVLAGAATCAGEGCPSVADGLATFDGVDDCLQFPHDDALVDTPVTLAAWVWSSADTQGMFLFGKPTGKDSQNTWELYVNYEVLAGQTLGFEMYGPPDVAVTVPIAFGTWRHIVGTWDGSTITSFVDGEQVGTADSMATSFDGHAVQIGCDLDSGVGAYFFPGWFSDLRIYRRALDATEIVELAAIVPPDPAPG